MEAMTRRLSRLKSYFALYVVLGTYGDKGSWKNE